MIKYYIKLAFSNFKANMLVFWGSIASVCLGALSLSFIYSFVYNELTMNKFYERGNDIYMITVKVSPVSAVEPIDASMLFNFNYKNYPELETLTNIKKLREGELRITVDQENYSPEILIADSAFFKIFSFKALTGDIKSALTNPDAALITENFAHKLFGNKNPIGQTLKTSFRGTEKSYLVKGVLENVPSNSSLKFEMILPSISGDFQRGGAEFVLAKKGFDKQIFNKKIEKLGRVINGFNESKISVTPLSEIYYNQSQFNAIMEIFFSRFGDKKNIYVLEIIMLILLSITALNFTNLQVVNVNSNIKNIGISKINGAKWQNIVYQKLIEILLIIFISALVCSGLYVLLLPFFNKVAGVDLNPTFGKILLLNATIQSIISLLALIYPLFLTLRLSAYRGIKEQVFTLNKFLGRRVIISFQFGLTILLLISSMLVIKQLQMMLNKDLGFTSKDIVNVKMIQRLPYIDNREEMNRLFETQNKNYQFVKNELMSSPYISGFTQGGSPLKVGIMPMKLKDGKDDFKSFNNIPVTESYLKLFDLKLIEGHFFNNEKDYNGRNQIVINEAAKKSWGISDISKVRILSQGAPDSEGAEIIGVVKDFNYEHLSVKPQPLIMFVLNNADMDFIVRFNKGSAQKGLIFLQQLFEKVNPGQKFSYSFLSDEIASLYQREKRTSTIYILFTIVSFLISTLGLYIISRYEIQIRTKEIGIRKVNGAKVIEILALFNKDFIKWVAFAFVISCLAGYYAMHKWLENFAYKTELSWWIFALAGLLAFVVALLTVSWQSWKAASRNPVEALRYE